MALGTDHVTLTLASAASRQRSNSAFIGEMWADEIIASFKANHVMGPLVHTLKHNRKKGDTFHVPRPIRGDASQKVAETQVTLIANQSTTTPYLIDQHWEYSVLIEDITAIQADDSLRAFITDDAGYALSKRTDTYLHALGAGFAGADAAPTVAGTAYSKAVVGTPSGSALVDWATTGDGNASTITDEGIRLMVQALDDTDTPSMGRVLVIPPVEKRKMLGIDRHVVFDQIGEAGKSNAIRNGYIAPLYGIDVYMSTNCAYVDDANSSANSTQRAALLFQRESLLYIEQLAPRTQTQYKQEYLSDLFTADTIFGGGILRPESGIAIIVAS